MGCRLFARIVCCVSLVAVSVVAGGVEAGAAPPGGGGSISGVVVDALANPVSGICVGVNAGPGAQSDGAGHFVIGGLASGSYTVRFDDCAAQGFITQWYLGSPDLAGATLVSVAGAAETQLSTVTMVRSATVSGTVTRAGGAPLAGICVSTAFPSQHGYNTGAGTSTGADGSYTLAGLVPGQVRIHFQDCSSNGPDLEAFNGGADSFDNAAPITLADGATVTGIDAQLSTGINVSGTVIDTDGNPLSGIRVSINPTDHGRSAFAQTDSSGDYSTGALPPGDYIVQFADASNPALWATQYWNGRPTRDNADTLTLVPANAPTRTGVNATLSIGATVSGAVTGAGGGPLGGICVSAVVGSVDNASGAGGTTTAPDGTYTLAGLPAGDVKIHFGDCNDVHTHIGQWWNNAAQIVDAQTLTLIPGEHRTGIDAVLANAGLISGTVTDQTGTGTPGVCVQASTSSSFGNSTTTDSNGRYTLSLSQGGGYRVQFVDCNSTPRLAGQWYPNQPTLTTATLVPIALGQSVTGIDAVLELGATSTISGRVVNRHGVAVTGGCVIAYLPDGYALPTVVNTDGTYTITGVPSGTYAVVFLGCGQGRHGDPSPTVPDPENPAINYNGVWWNGVPVIFPPAGDQGGPDPFAQGAKLVAVTPGAHLTGYDHCFGCVSVTITSVTPGVGSLTIAFTATEPGLAGVQSLASTPPALTYAASCASANGGTPGIATGTSSPITVAGLTPSATYTCTVKASDQTATIDLPTPSPPVAVIAATNPSASVIPAMPTAPAGSGIPTTPKRPTTHLPGQLAITGSSLTDPLGRAGAISLLVGLLIVFATRQRQQSRTYPGLTN